MSQEQPSNTNQAAEQDVQNVLAELKGETKTETETTAAPAADPQPEAAAPEETKPTEAPAPAAAAAAAETEAEEEARVIAAAQKIGQDAANKEEKTGSDATQQQQGRAGIQRTRGGLKKQNFRENVKSDLTSGEVTSDPEEIRKQVEFYFSDSNLPMDKFLLSKVGGSTNNPVPLSLLHSFKRMRRFQPFEAIVSALKDSTFLELTDNDTAVRRRNPLPEAVTAEADRRSVVKMFEDQAMKRSIYAKGFGAEEPSTQFDIEAFFTPYGPTNAIRLRRTVDKTFKGSVFVEFESEELAQKFLALDPKPKWKGEVELMIKRG
ncbi:hypothetical protein KEM56_004694 [Ascosphaera pollenicola]|nr:hypothetical protein KEM56_004694 [Ascosphaera pollenicola]